MAVYICSCFARLIIYYTFKNHVTYYIPSNYNLLDTIYIVLAHGNPSQKLMYFWWLTMLVFFIFVIHVKCNYCSQMSCSSFTQENSCSGALAF